MNKKYIAFVVAPAVALVAAAAVGVASVSAATPAHTNMQQKYTDRLNQAATDGKLTQAQVVLITTENASIKSQLDQLKTIDAGKTRQQMMADTKAIMDSAKTWATQNSIP